jgi:hypothetical protein
MLLHDIREDIIYRADDGDHHRHRVGDGWQGREDPGDDGDPGEPDPDESEGVDVLVHDPVKDRAKIGMGIVFPSNNPVNKVEDPGNEERKASPGKCSDGEHKGADDTCSQ